MIAGLTLHRLEIPLTTPYKLAFGPVRHFDTLIAEVRLADGRTGLGEATILEGYTDETVAESWAKMRDIAPGLVSLTPDDARARAGHALDAFPFTVTALVTAIEMAAGSPHLAHAQALAVPILHGLNATDPDGIAHELEAALAHGYRTIKVKVGFDLEADLTRVALIQRLNRGRAALRIDGNQGYTPAEGADFASRVAPDSIELLEQPCAAEDWDAAAHVAAVTAVPLMLDESIYTIDDIDRAAKVGAAFVKLKLMKLGSIEALVRGLARIRALGMKPVLGNGVASDVGCWMELMVAARHIDNAGEMNGFLRTTHPVATDRLAVHEGCVHVPAGWRPTLDPARLAAWQKDIMAVGATTPIPEKAR